MAALRLGGDFADERIIAVLKQNKPPYNINILTQETALQALPYRMERPNRQYNSART